MKKLWGILPYFCYILFFQKEELYTWQWIFFSCCIVGASCNRIAIRYNGGLMPVKGLTEMSSVHRPMTEHTKLKFLCDIFPVKIFRLRLTFSIGDVFLYTAICIGLWNVATSVMKFLI